MDRGNMVVEGFLVWAEIVKIYAAIKGNASLEEIASREK